MTELLARLTALETRLDAYLGVDSTPKKGSHVAP